MPPATQCHVPLTGTFRLVFRLIKAPIFFVLATLNVIRPTKKVLLIALAANRLNHAQQYESPRSGRKQPTVADGQSIPSPLVHIMQIMWPLNILRIARGPNGKGKRKEGDREREARSEYFPSSSSSSSSVPSQCRSHLRQRPEPLLIAE